jgi:hypothetical protein
MAEHYCRSWDRLPPILGGPALYPLGESLFGWRMTGVARAHRVAVAALLILLAPLGGQIEVLPLSIVVAAILTGLAVWERSAPDRVEASAPARVMPSAGARPLHTSNASFRADS